MGATYSAHSGMPEHPALVILREAISAAFQSERTLEAESALQRTCHAAMSAALDALEGTEDQRQLRILVEEATSRSGRT